MIQPEVIWLTPDMTHETIKAILTDVVLDEDCSIQPDEGNQ